MAGTGPVMLKRAHARIEYWAKYTTDGEYPKVIYYEFYLGSYS